MNHLRNLIKYANDPEEVIVPEFIIEQIKLEYSHMISILNNKKTVYGSNTLVGHKDNFINEDLEYLNNIIKSHSIGYGESFTEKESRYIASSRIVSWMTGGTGVSIDTFFNFITYYKSNNYCPNIPKNCSYSSGDVIPATHLLNCFLKHNNKSYEYPVTDIMPFINGNFIQLGFATSLISRINKLWSIYLYNSIINCNFFESNQSNFILYDEHQLLSKELKSLFLRISTHNKKTQDIISIRSLPQQFNKFIQSFQDFCKVINESLSKPSGNPLFNLSYDSAISQASFLSLDITDVTLKLLNTLKLISSVVVNRSAYLLSGKVNGVPQDASKDDSDLGLIQFPKLMMAIEEEISLAMPSVNYYNSKVTSEGVEDLWNNGLHILNKTKKIIELATDLLHIELYIHLYLQNYFNKNLNFISGNDFELIDYTDLVNLDQQFISLPMFMNEKRDLIKRLCGNSLIKSFDLEKALNLKD